MFLRSSDQSGVQKVMTLYRILAFIVMLTTVTIKLAVSGVAENYEPLEPLKLVPVCVCVCVCV